MNLLTPAIIEEIDFFATATANAWIAAGLIKSNSWGVEILALPPTQGGDWGIARAYHSGHTRPGAVHPKEWYLDNAHGKNLICAVTGLDSHEAVRVWQGRIRHIHGAFPWGGAIIDAQYGLIVGTSGFKEDEDILFSRTLRNRIVMMLDREGDRILNDARLRGEREGDDSADRFTNAIDVVPLTLLQ